MVLLAAQLAALLELINQLYHQLLNLNHKLQNNFHYYLLQALHLFQHQLI